MMRKKWKSRLISAAVSAAMIVTMIPTTALGAALTEEAPAALAAEAVSKPAGEGTESAPYLITGPEELRWFAELVNGTLEGVEQNTSACARLENDISLTADMEARISWTPIGFGTDESGRQTAYTGTFDGASHVIDTLYLETDAEESYVGLFGANEGTIRDLTVNYASIVCGEFVHTEPNQDKKGAAGVIAGINRGVIADCSVSVAGVSASYHAGTLVGVNDGRIERSTAELAAVIGSVYVGGVAGDNAPDARISEVSFDGIVYGVYLTGGIVGENDGTIEDSRFQGYAATLPYEWEDGTKSASYYGGGIAGYNFGVIRRCESGVHPSEEPADGQEPEETSETEIRGVLGIGGIVGASCGTISDCHNHAVVAGKCQETENDPFPSQIGGIVGRIFCYNDPDGSPQRGVVTGCDNYGFVSVGIAEADPGQLQPEDIKDGGYAGGIAGICLGGTIEDCANHMQVSGNEEIGGIAGYAGDEAFAADGPLCAVIRNCSNDVSGYTIRGITNAGGIAGCVASSGDLIEQCRNSGMIVADGEDAGGIAGIMGGGTIDKSFNEGSVTAASCAGGIIGSAEAEDGDICITSCYNRGTITGESATGGIAGSVSITETVPGPVKIANCYNSGWVSVSRDPADAGAADGAGGVLGSLIYEKDTDAVSVTNCYYLNGSVDGSGIYGTEDAESGVYGMDQADFADGHVTWLLQNGVDDDVLVWGQKLPQFYDTYDEFPVLAQVEEEKVVSVIWLADDEVVHEGFANPGEMLDITVNKDIVKEGYFLDGWYTDPEYTTEWDFAADTAGIEDLYLYARWIPEEELLYGDADKNGIVDSADALFILQYVVKLVQPDAPQFSYGAADVDGNLAITVEDAFLVLQKAVEIIDRFPIQEAAAAGLKQ